MKFKKHTAGDGGWSDWVQPRHGEAAYKMACCDCGLVHDMHFEVMRFEAANSTAGQFMSDGVTKAVFRVRRNTRSTGQMRRKKKA